MSATQITIAQNLNSPSRKERNELFRKIMKPINANRKQNKKVINCGHVVLKLNQLLHNLAILQLKQESELDIPAVPTDNAGQWFFYDKTQRKTRLENMNTNNQALIDRCALETIETELLEPQPLETAETKKLIDLTKEDRICINLTLDNNTKTDPFYLKPATYSDITDKLKKLPRRAEDKTAFGFLLYTKPTSQGKIGNELHAANFLVDSNDEVYFLDAQPEALYISDKPLPGYIPDIFYACSSAPLLEKTISPASATQNSMAVKIKQEPGSVVTTLTSAAASASTSSFPFTSASAPGSTARTAASFSISASAPGSSASASAPGSTATATASSSTIFASYPTFSASSSTPVVAEANSNGNQGQLKSMQTNGIGTSKKLDQKWVNEPVLSIQQLRQLDFDAIKAIQEKADSGNPIAQTHIGICYLVPIKLPKDSKKAFNYFELSAKQGHLQGQINLAFCYVYARGVQQNDELALPLLEVGVKQGNHHAQYILGLMHQRGNKILPKNDKLALYNIKLSAAQNYGPALTALASYYKNGIGTLTRLDPKWENSRKCRGPNELQKLNSTQFEDLKRDANFGNPIAQYELSVCFFHGLHVAAKDYQSAFVYAELSAEQGYIPGLYNLAYCYLRAIGVRQNLPLAVTLFTLAAEQHYPSAQWRLGLLYRDGRGVQPNGKTALHYMKLSAAQNCAPALSALADFYAKGIGCAKQLPKDLKLRQELTSEELKRLSPEQFLGIIDEATSGNPVAQSELVTCYMFGIQVIINDQRDYKIKYYSELAAEQGYAPGQYKLGRCYESGTGVVINIELAKVLYGLAAEQGDRLRLAQDALIRLTAINPKSIASSSASSVAPAMSASASSSSAADLASPSSVGTVIAVVSNPIANEAKTHNEAVQLHVQKAVSQSNRLDIADVAGQLDKMSNSFSNIFQQLSGQQQAILDIVKKQENENTSLKKELQATKQELRSLIQRLQPILNTRATTTTTVTNGRAGLPVSTASVTTTMPNAQTASASASASASNASASASGQTALITSTSNRVQGSVQGTIVNKDLRRFESVETVDSEKQQQNAEGSNKRVRL